MIVAIDGPVGAGKSTVGRRVAQELHLPFVDSGHMYRALAWLALERNIEPDQADELSRLASEVKLRVQDDGVWADSRELTGDIYRPEINATLSLVSQVPGVRKALVVQQRESGATGVVMAGRDIGTVVFPDADYKFFLTASLDERVRRRAQQYERRGQPADHEAMRKEVAERDRLDSERSLAPLKAAADAIVVNTDGMTLDEVVQSLLRRLDFK